MRSAGFIAGTVEASAFNATYRTSIRGLIEWLARQAAAELVDDDAEVVRRRVVAS